MEKKPTAGIILAAGMSKRFGSLKQLANLGNRTILSMVLESAKKSDLDQILLVLGYKSETIIKALGCSLDASRVKVVLNPAYREGMSSSLQRGVMKIKDDFPSIMIILGDQPYLKTETINLLLDGFRNSNKDICVPVYQGRRGLPVCISGKYYHDVFDIEGDIGAREIISKNQGDVLFVDVDDQGCLLDIDRVKDIRG